MHIVYLIDYHLSMILVISIKYYGHLLEGKVIGSASFIQYLQSLPLRLTFNCASQYVVPADSSSSYSSMTFTVVSAHSLLVQDFLYQYILWPLFRRLLWLYVSYTLYII